MTVTYKEGAIHKRFYIPKLFYLQTLQTFNRNYGSLESNRKKGWKKSGPAVQWLPPSRKKEEERKNIQNIAQSKITKLN